MIYPLLHLPFTILVTGSSKSGKTTFVDKLLYYQNDIIADPKPKCYAFERILVIYASWASVYEKWMSKYGSRISFQKNIPADLEEIIKSWNVRSSLVILDDMMQNDDPIILALYTRISHHLCVSAICLLHNIYDRSNKILRSLSLNTNGIIVFRSLRDQKQIYSLSYQIFAERKRAKRLIEAFQDVFNEKYSYMYIDLSPAGNDKLRFLTDIFAEKNPYPVVYKI
jgi:GTPase SAR1 family protein